MIFEFGGFRLDAAQRRLFAPDGPAVELPSRAFDLLLYCVERPGALLEKSTLLKAIWPNTVVEESNLSQCIFVLRRALGDTTADHRFIATVPGRGYQFVAPVLVAASPATPAAPPAPITPQPVDPPDRPRSRPLRAAVAAGVLLAAAATAIFWLRTHPTSSSATRSTPDSVVAPFRTIAVMPFADLSPAHDMDYFTEGIAEELMNNLARVASLRVVGRRSTMALQGTKEDARSIGARLKVDGILEGSVRKSGERLRITAQLVRTSDGFSLWSQTYDRKLDDVLDVQSSIAREVTAALSPVVTKGAAPSSADSPTKNADAYDAYLRGIYLFGRGTHVDVPRAIEEFRRATELDPEFALAHLWLGRTHAWLARRGIGDMAENRKQADASLASALELNPGLAEIWWVQVWPTNVDNLPFAMRANILERALATDRSDPAPMLQLSFVYMLMGRREDALAIDQRAYEADPLWPNSLSAVANDNFAFGDPARAERILRELETVAPNDSRAADTRAYMAGARGLMLDWDKWKARAIVATPRDQPLHGLLSLDYGHLGLLDAALYHARMCHVLNPGSAGAEYNESTILMFAGDINSSRPVVRRAMARHPEDYMAQLAQATLQYFDGDCSGALHLTELARPAFRQPAASLNLVADGINVPIFVFCLRQQGYQERAQEVMRVATLQFGGNMAPGLYDGLLARVAAAAGDRDALVSYLKAVDRTHTMDFTFVRHEPMIQPYLKDTEVVRLLDSIDARLAEWRKIIPKSSMKVPVPDAPAAMNAAN